ncbi:DUF1120 domain-containing protein [Atlantibacter sp.]|uniref:DUF1120 domain-containing protein n=1 Tax=Atlantibacter sp. TaxID=1903473 RepID=UPI0028A6B147|nr:DUF1120 domain-containing protein [Atlantibacter sp.]
MFKKSATCLLGFLMMAGSAFSSDSVDLKISALFESGACTPSLSNGGEANFGDIPFGTLSKTQENQLGSRFLTLTIACTQMMPVGWTVTDNKKESLQALTIKAPKYNNEDLNDASYEFGLGKTAAGVKLGAYAIYTDINNVMADGIKVNVVSRYGGGNWYDSGAGEIKDDPTFTITASILVSDAYVPVAAKTFTWPLKVTAAVQSAHTLNLSDTTSLDGSTTISLVYL